MAIHVDEIVRVERRRANLAGLMALGVASAAIVIALNGGFGGGFGR